MLPGVRILEALGRGEYKARRIQSSNCKIYLSSSTYASTELPSHFSANGTLQRMAITKFLIRLIYGDEVQENRRRYGDSRKEKNSAAESIPIFIEPDE